MFIIANFIEAVATIIYFVLNIFMWIIIARAILSWVSPDPFNPIVRFINNITEPVLYQVRRWLPVGFSGIDFSPIIVLLAIIFLQKFVVESLHSLSAALIYK